MDTEKEWWEGTYSDIVLLVTYNQYLPSHVCTKMRKDVGGKDIPSILLALTNWAASSIKAFGSDSHSP